MAEDEPKAAAISVAMATYNGARFLREQLDSIARQTIPPVELVITDDASSDATAAVVAAFAEAAPFPVRFHRNPQRLGYRANFLRAISLCTAPLVAFCDQDDIWAPVKLERCGAVFGDPEVLLCYHEAWLIDGEGARSGLATIFPLLPRNPPSSTTPMINPYGFSMVFRRELVTLSDLWALSVDNLRPGERMAHDQWVFFLASALGTIAYLDEPLASYRLHGANTYGLDPPARTFRERMGRWITVRSRDYAGFREAAAARAAILEQAAARVASPWRARALLAAECYRRLARHSTQRAALYGPAGIGRRAGAWLDMLRSGAYGNATRWTFGRKAALVDLACLLLPARLRGDAADR